MSWSIRSSVLHGRLDADFVNLLGAAMGIAAGSNDLLLPRAASEVMLLS
jgi:hypothetical protein